MMKTEDAKFAEYKMSLRNKVESEFKHARIEREQLVAVNLAKGAECKAELGMIPAQPPTCASEVVDADDSTFADCKPWCLTSGASSVRWSCHWCHCKTIWNSEFVDGDGFEEYVHNIYIFKSILALMISFLIIQKACALKILR